MKRLSWQWVNRLLVLIALVLPIFYVVIWCFNLKGAGVVPQDLTKHYATDDIWWYILANNPLTQLGLEISDNAPSSSWGFKPISEFIYYLAVNWFGNPIDAPGDSVYAGTLLALLYGYLWWVFHVLLFDVLINGVTFFFRFIKKLMYMFEKED